MRRPALVGVAAALGVGLAIAIAYVQRDSEPGPSGAEVFAQDASDSVDGLTIQAEWSTFSGTETMVGLVLSSEDPKSVPIEQVVVPPASVSSPDAAGRPSVVGLDPEGLAVELPPLGVPDNWLLVIEYVYVVGDSRSDRVDGPWVLQLAGPPSDRFDELTRVEQFQATTIDVLGNAVTVSGLRSTSRTIFRYQGMGTLRELAGPVLELPGGTVLRARTWGNDGDVQVAEFNPTPFGTNVALRFGPFGAEEETGGTIVRVRLQDALDRAAISRDNAGTAAVLPGDIVEGPDDIVQSVKLDKGEGPNTRQISEAAPPPGEIDTVELRLSGSWHPQEPVGDDLLSRTPALIDAAGQRLWSIYVGTGYSKSPGGAIREGQTDVRFYLPDDADLSTVSVVLGPSSTVLAGDWVAEMQPVPSTSP